jgi:glycosyltransferase involved in cell wall biosynthesis
MNYLADFINDLRILGLTRRHSYDVIQVKDKYVTAVFCLAVARFRKIPFCFWLAYPHAEANLHGARHRIVRYPLFYWFRGMYQSMLLYRLLLPAANHVFVQSEQMREDIAAKGIDRSKMTPIPGSLDLSRVPFRGTEDPGPEGKRLLYVGTLIRERRLDFLVRVFSALPDRHHDAELVFVGAGENPEDEALIEREIERTGVARERVIFAGRMPRDRVWRHIEESAVCVSPYFPTFILNSTSPTKLLEYMAMGRPVIANEHPEQSLVLNESGAGFAVAWDEQAFANAITELLDNPEKSRRMGAAGRAWVESNRSNRILANAVEGVYDCLINTSGNRDA